MVVFSPFVLLLCTLWELCARFLIDILLFTDKKKMIGRWRRLKGSYIFSTAGKLGPTRGSFVIEGVYV